MGRKLYVGNLPVSAGEAGLQQFLSTVGTATTIHLGIDGDTRRPCGFAFVEMTTEEEAAQAIAVLDQTAMGGRQITVSPPPRLRRQAAPPKTINNEFGGRDVRRVPASEVYEVRAQNIDNVFGRRRRDDSRFVTAFAV